MKEDDKLKAVSMLMTMMMKASGLDTTRPDAMLAEEVNKLTPNAQDVWTNLTIDFQRISLKEAQILSKLLIHKYFTTMQIVDSVRIELLKESRNTVDYIRNHEEYREKVTEEELKSILNNALEDDE